MFKRNTNSRLKAGLRTRTREVTMTKEEIRLQQSRERRGHWKRWGPDLRERARGAGREGYRSYGNARGYLPHDHARSKAYRWGEDGIGGISDRHQFICFAVSMWNGRDPILKERKANELMAI